MSGGSEVPPLFLPGDMGCEGKMARLILNCEGVGLVMRELGRDILMIGRASIESHSHWSSDSFRAARRASEGPRLLFAKGFKFNERDTDQWRFCH
jgi:hypothetical protein